MKYGANYTPRGGWFYSWSNPDFGQVKEDFEALRGMGLDHVRILPLWPLLQPNRHWIDPQAVSRVVRVAELAGEASLEVSVDVLQGHLSSYDFLPSWVETWHQRNIFSDPQVVEAQGNLVARLATELRALPNATGLCLGNEIVQFAAERHPRSHPISSQQAEHWLHTLLRKAEEQWPQGQHVHCFDDDVWFENSQPFTPIMAAQMGAMTTVHSWVFGKVGERYGLDAPELGWFARYLCELAHAWGPERPIWLQEVGAPYNFISRENIESFVRTTVNSLLGADGGGVAPGLTAITWWCSHNVSSQFADFPSVEYTLGLLDDDNSLTPTGIAFADSIAHIESAPETARTTLEFCVADDGHDRSVTSPFGDLFSRWVAKAQNGQFCALRRVPEIS